MAKHMPAAMQDVERRQQEEIPASRVWKLHIFNHICLRPLFAFARHCALVSVTWDCSIDKLTDVGLFKSAVSQKSFNSRH